MNVLRHLNLKTTMTRGIVLVSVGIAAIPTFAHELPDNFLEKTLAVIVRDRSVQIEYSLGVNDRTLADLVKIWRREETVRTQTTDSNPGAANVPDAANSDDSPTEPELADQFRQLAFDKIADQLKVLIDGKAIRLEKVSVESTPMHHVSISARFSFSIPDRESMKLLIDDQCFKNLDGASRYSLKAMGSALIIRSNVAPIIIRAPRHELAKLTMEQRSKVSRIEANIGLVRQQPKEIDTHLNEFLGGMTLPTGSFPLFLCMSAT